jgi:chromosome segregation ATPase
MDGQRELDTRIARLEAALGAAARALEAARAVPDRSGELAAAQAALSEARGRIEGLEGDLSRARAEASDLQDRLRALEAAPAPKAASGPIDADEAVELRAAVEALTATSAELRAQAPGAADRALEAELDALRAARALDLAEMEAILTELDPLLTRSPEGAHA